jgi:hypothetical protein
VSSLPPLARSGLAFTTVGQALNVVNLHRAERSCPRDSNAAIINGYKDTYCFLQFLLCFLVCVALLLPHPCPHRLIGLRATGSIFIALNEAAPEVQMQKCSTDTLPSIVSYIFFFVSSCVSLSVSLLLRFSFPADRPRPRPLRPGRQQQSAVVQHLAGDDSLHRGRTMRSGAAHRRPGQRGATAAMRNLAVDESRGRCGLRQRQRRRRRRPARTRSPPAGCLPQMGNCQELPTVSSRSASSMVPPVCGPRACASDRSRRSGSRGSGDGDSST